MTDIIRVIISNIDCNRWVARTINHKIIYFISTISVSEGDIVASSNWICICPGSHKVIINVNPNLTTYSIINQFKVIPSIIIKNMRHINNRSEEHTSELQSRPHIVCRLLLEKKKKERFN